jgi:hypothetical protein
LDARGRLQRRLAALLDLKPSDPSYLTLGVSPLAPPALMLPVACLLWADNQPETVLQPPESSSKAALAYLTPSYAPPRIDTHISPA